MCPRKTDWFNSFAVYFDLLTLEGFKAFQVILHWLLQPPIGWKYIFSCTITTQRRLTSKCGHTSKGNAVTIRGPVATFSLGLLDKTGVSLYNLRMGLWTFSHFWTFCTNRVFVVFCRWTLVHVEPH